jgi:hypothetical protein
MLNDASRKEPLRSALRRIEAAGRVEVRRHTRGKAWQIRLRPAQVVAATNG